MEKTIYRKYNLATNGKRLHISLRALFRAVGVGGAVEKGVLPVEVLDGLSVGIIKPGVTGIIPIPRGTGDNTYAVDGEQMTIRVTKLPAGRSQVVVKFQYGTNRGILLQCDLVVRNFIPYFLADGTYTPLERLVAKDEEVDDVTYYAYAYLYGGAIVWFENEAMDFNAASVTAFVADSLEDTIADATEEDGRLVYNADVAVYDEESEIEVGVTDQFKPAASGVTSIGGASGDVLLGDGLQVETDEDGNPVLDANNMKAVTYSDLVDLVEAGSLVAGRYYRITDYVTTVANDDEARVDNPHAFDVIVLALDGSTLSENAFAMLHDGDDDYFATSNLAAWRLKYCLQNDTNRFTWADTENGKGVIYEMVDEFNNRCGYDFKNIQFKRYLILDGPLENTYFGVKGGKSTIDDTDYIWVHTFAMNTTTDDITNMSANDDWHEETEWLTANNCYNDEGGLQSVNDNSFGDCYTDEYGYNYGKLLRLANNVMIAGCTYDEDNTRYYSEYAYGQYGCRTGLNCSSWTCGNNCNYWTCGNYCYSWTCGNECSYWTCGNDCSSWTCGNYCSSWTCGNNCSSWTCGNNCYSWTCGNYCYSWTCGNYCYSWACGNDCYSWACGNYCSSWACGNYCSYWTCGNDCSSWTCGNECSYWAVDNLQTSTDNKLQYFHIANGTRFNSKTQIAFTTAVNYPQYAGFDSDGDLVVKNIFD